MARPAKSVKVKTGAIASKEADLRGAAEEKLRGKAQKPSPPEYLPAEQKEIFRFIADGLEEADILGNLDVFVLESTAVAIMRLRQINRMIDMNPQLLFDTALQGARAKNQSDLWRGCNELCLSPQARAKLGNMAAQAVKAKEDPLIALLEEN